jgi:hypothetical protein
MLGRLQTSRNGERQRPQLRLSDRSFPRAVAGPKLKKRSLASLFHAGAPTS